MTHGTGIYSRFSLGTSESQPLSLEPGYIAGIVRKIYAVQLVRMTIEGTSKQWVLLNVHLSAFDEGAEIRKRQFIEVINIALNEYEQGNHVVLGGDWNMLLANSEFPHTTDEKLLFWVFDIPHEAIPDGWRLVADETTPSVRTDHKPYVAGENYTAIIDGFLVSPNVAVESVETIDLGFTFTDHQPVQAEFRAR